MRSLLRPFFADYLRLAEPDSAEHLRLDGLSMLDLPEMPPEGRGLGLAAEVPDVRGETVTVLVRIEPEAPGEEELSGLLSRWLGVLGIVYGRPVLLHVLCLERCRPGASLATAVVARVSGQESLRLFYTCFGLAGARAEHYLERPEPLAWALAAWMRPARHSRMDLLEACRRRIAAADLADDLRPLLRSFVEAGAERIDPDRNAVDREP